MKRIPLYLLLFLCTPAALAHGTHDHARAGSHEHGILNLSLAADGQDLVLALESPAINLLGFEHSPATPREKAALAAALDSLRQPATLLQLSSAARCSLQSTSVESPWQDGHPPAANNHADFQAEYRYRCQQPAALDSLEAGGLLQRWPGIGRIRLEYALPQRQGQQTLDRRQAKARLAR